jgi:uncharacterized alpha-E superfamily protein
MLSRVANSLYWLSRYLERAEHTARLIHVQLNLAPDQSPATSDQRRQRILLELRTTATPEALEDDYGMMEYLTFNTTNSLAIVSCIALARENARQVREQISTEMWQQLNQLYLFVRNRRMDTVWANQPSEFLHSIKEGSHLFQGITDSTMSHGQGWHFIQLGRYIERAISCATLLDVEYEALMRGHNADIAADAYLNWIGLLKGCTAYEAYSKEYTADIKPERVIEFLLLNSNFPHSICFAVNAIQETLDAIAEITETHRGTRVYRLSGRLRATLDYAQIDEVMSGETIHGGLHPFLEDIRRQCLQIHEALFRMYITYPIEEKLVA